MKRLFVIGDSISIQYGPYLKRYISDDLAYDRKRGEEEALKDLDHPVGANGGDSKMVLDYLKEQESKDMIHYDILLLNCGLHDIKTDIRTGEKQVDLAAYEKNLREICNLLKNKNVQVIWVRTTPVDDAVHNNKDSTAYRYNADVLRYNCSADSIMSAYNIPIIDLYSVTKKFGDQVYCDHVHFKEEVRKMQAAYIAGFLNSIACKKS